MAEIVKLWAKQAVNSALHHHNRLDMTLVHNLPLNSEVLIWHESGNWTGPYHLLAVENKMYYIQLPNRPTSFKSTSVKSYFQFKDTHNAKLDKLEVPTELNKLEVPLSTLKVPPLTLKAPQEPTEPTKPAVKYG
jgi:hypothetical protein